MHLTKTLRTISARKGPLLFVNPLNGIPKDTPIEIKSFDDPLAMRIFMATQPKRTRVKFPALPPFPDNLKLDSNNQVIAKDQLGNQNEPYFEHTLKIHEQRIIKYINNLVKGYDPIRLTETEQKIAELGMNYMNLRKDLHPDSYRSFVWFYENNMPIPDYFFEEDLTTIPIHSSIKHLTEPKRKTGGRDSSGRIAVRHIGGGFRRRIRFVNTSRNFANPVVLVRYEHDPNRTTKIALVQDIKTKELQYVLMPEGLQPGILLDNSETIIQPGMTLPLKQIPSGTKIFNLEIHPGKGGQLVRSAGTYAAILGANAAKEIVSVKLPSGKIKEIDERCTATIGSASNPEWNRIDLGKAGRARNLGIRPTVRGTAMNANDHPMGGGKGGKSKGHQSQSPWGKRCK